MVAFIIWWLKDLTEYQSVKYTKAVLPLGRLYKVLFVQMHILFRSG